MPPSSLIFAVILAVWAAYLVQHWIRRRDHVATARSVDRFSEAMRVLERRQRRPHLDLSEPVARSYSVSPTRPPAPEVMVKRARPTPAKPAPGRSAVAARPPSTSAVTERVSGAPAPSPVVRARGFALLAAAGIMVLGTALGVLGILPWWTATAGIGVFVAVVAVVRVHVRRSVPAAATTRRWSADAAAGTSSPAASARKTSVDVPAASHQDDAEDLAGAVAGAAQSSVYDVEQVVASTSRPSVGAAPTRSVPTAPGTWQPVPVPPPTYSLKAKAHTPPLPPELPADGTDLSLDEEFEELPTAIRGLA